jgi:hypothetical protein
VLQSVDVSGSLHFAGLVLFYLFPPSKQVTALFIINPGINHALAYLLLPAGAAAALRGASRPGGRPTVWYDRRMSRQYHYFNCNTTCQEEQSMQGVMVHNSKSPQNCGLRSLAELSGGVRGNQECEVSTRSLSIYSRAPRALTTGAESALEGAWEGVHAAMELRQRVHGKRCTVMVCRMCVDFLDFMSGRRGSASRACRKQTTRHLDTRQECCAGEQQAVKHHKHGLLVVSHVVYFLL